VQCCTYDIYLFLQTEGLRRIIFAVTNDSMTQTLNKSCILKVNALHLTQLSQIKCRRNSKSKEIKHKNDTTKLLFSKKECY